MVPLSQSPETQEQMEASMKEENGSDRIKRFLSVYRPMECHCCNTVFGFQHKVTGMYFCAFKENSEALSSCYLMSGMETSVGNPLMKTGVHNAIQAQNLLMANAAAEAKNYQAAVRSLSGLKMDENTVPKLVTPPPSACVDAVDGAHSVVYPVPVEKLRQPAPQTATAPLLKAKPAAAETVVSLAPSKRYLWPDCKYSSKLTNKANVVIPFAWNATTVLVNAVNDGTGLENLQAKLMEYAKIAKPMKTPPVVGEIVVAEYDGAYYRSRVTKLDGETCKVVFVDYGDQAACKYSEILPVDDKIMAYPIYGLTVHLENLPADPKVSLTDKLYDVITSNTFQLELSQPNQLQMLIPSDVPVEAKLWDGGDGMSLNETIQGALFPAPAAPELQKKIPIAAKPTAHLWSNCKYSPSFKSGAKVFVQFQYTATHYHLAVEKDAADLEQFQAVLAEFAEKAKPLNGPPVREQIVIGQYDDQFYRARVEKIESEESCRVVFVDYGDKKSYKVSELLQVDDSIMKYPIYGMIAQLENVPKPPTGGPLKYSDVLENVLNDAMSLDVCSEDQLVPSEKSYVVTVRLFNADRDYNVNLEMTKAIAAAQ